MTRQRLEDELYESLRYWRDKQHNLKLTYTEQTYARIQANNIQREIDSLNLNS